MKCNECAKEKTCAEKVKRYLASRPGYGEPLKLCKDAVASIGRDTPNYHHPTENWTQAGQDNFDNKLIKFPQKTLEEKNTDAEFNIPGCYKAVNLDPGFYEDVEDSDNEVSKVPPSWTGHHTPGQNIRTFNILGSGKESKDIREADVRIDKFISLKRSLKLRQEIEPPKSWVSKHEGDLDIVIAKVVPPAMRTKFVHALKEIKGSGTNVNYAAIARRHGLTPFKLTSWLKKIKTKNLMVRALSNLVKAKTTN